jgi:hypothetical protein
MKHEFKVGELVRFIEPKRLITDSECGSGLGFINKITPLHVVVVYANGYASAYPIWEFNNRFERATNIK